jgi:glucose-1-phosphate thymidylyltransferase
LIIAENFIGESSAALILGDNIFHGPGLGRRLSAFTNVSGARVFGYHVNDPSSYGVLLTDPQGKILKIVEKPTQFISHIAIPGLYFFDAQASRIARAIRPSARGELEITEVLSRYLENGELAFEMLPRGTSWFDSGTFSDLHDAATFVRLMQERTGEQVGNPFDVSEAQGWK